MDIHGSNRPRRAEQHGCDRADLAQHTAVQFVFPRRDALLRVQHRRFPLFQCGRHVAFGVCERLCAAEVGRHARPVRIAHLDAVPEHAVVFDLQAADARALAFGGLHRGNRFPRVRGRMHERIEVGIVAGANAARVFLRHGARAPRG